MKLYFLRHAEAVDGPVDDIRELSGRGRRDARRMGRFFDRGGVRFDLAFTSPLIRARQTAEIVVDRCPLARRAKLQATPMLLNETSATAFCAWLAKLPDVEAVLLVGHEPSLSARVCALLGIATEKSLPLSKGAVARVDTDDRRAGTLKLLAGPKQIP